MCRIFTEQQLHWKMGKLFRLYFGGQLPENVRPSEGFWIGAERLLDSRPYFGRDDLSEEIIEAMRVEPGDEGVDWQHTGLDLEEAMKKPVKVG